MIFHISHGARRSDSANDVDWFIVKPLDGETEKSVINTPITHVDAVNSLLRAGRTVFELDTETMTAMVINKDAASERAERG